MQLETLIKDMPITLRTSAADVAITCLTDDSRAVQPGSLFVARPGADGDATRFVAQAIQAGAAAVLLPTMDAAAIDRLNVPDTVAIAQSQTPIDQRLCGQLAERFYNHPSRKLKLIGVTGTNGKTTTVTIAKHLLESAGHKTGLIGTVELDTGSPQGPTPATLTTPGAIQLTELLAEMVDNDCACCVIEVSSHALHQGRADHVRFTAAAFTNLTQDHLDYHGDMQAYADAKAILFESLDEDATAVLNIDDRASRRMQANCKGRVLHTDILGLGDSASAGHATDTMCTVTPTKMTAAHSQAEFAGPWQCFAATLPMPGLFNLNNALQAAALAYTAAGLDAAQLRQGLETCHAVPGRLEPVGPDWPQPVSPNADLPSVLVDYAHTPDALINVGNALHQLTQPIGGKLITVFGCGGDRDRNKRPLMAQAAQQFADTVVFTSDNPRTEDPQQILNDAEAGFAPRDMTDPNPETHTIADRAEAIRFAIHLATENDTVLIAGKGHEDYQIIGTTKHHFDDREQAAAALREKSGQ